MSFNIIPKGVGLDIGGSFSIFQTFSNSVIHSFSLPRGKGVGKKHLNSQLLRKTYSPCKAMLPSGEHSLLLTLQCHVLLVALPGLWGPRGSFLGHLPLPSIHTGFLSALFRASFSQAISPHPQFIYSPRLINMSPCLTRLSALQTHISSHLCSPSTWQLQTSQTLQAPRPKSHSSSSSENLSPGVLAQCMFPLPPPIPTTTNSSGAKIPAMTQTWFFHPPHSQHV